MSGDVRAEMCERRCANRDEFLTRGLQCSAQGFAGASGGVASGDVASGDVLAGMCVRGWFLTRGLQCSEQGFAGARGDVASGDV